MYFNKPGTGSPSNHQSTLYITPGGDGKHQISPTGIYILLHVLSFLACLSFTLFLWPMVGWAWIPFVPLSLSEGFWVLWSPFPLVLIDVDSWFSPWLYTIFYFCFFLAWDVLALVSLARLNGCLRDQRPHCPRRSLSKSKHDAGQVRLCYVLHVHMWGWWAWVSRRRFPS